MRATRRLLVYNEADLLLLLWRLVWGDCANSAGLGRVCGSVGQGVVARGGKRVWIVVLGGIFCVNRGTILCLIVSHV